MIWQVSWLAESDLLLKQGLESTTEGLTVCVREAVPVSLQCFGCTVLAFCLTVFLQSLGLATAKASVKKDRPPQKASVSLRQGDLNRRLYCSEGNTQVEESPSKVHPTNPLGGRNHWRAGMPDADWWARGPEEEREVGDVGEQ